MRALVCALLLSLLLSLSLAAPAFADSPSFAVSTMVDKARLDPASATKVQAIVEKYRDKIDQLRHQDRELVRSIRVQLASTPNDKAVARLTDQLVKNRNKLRDLRADRLSSIKKALPPSLFARLLLAMPKIDRALELRARERNSDS